MQKLYVDNLENITLKKIAILILAVVILGYMVNGIN